MVTRVVLLFRYHVNYWPEFPISPSTWNTK